MKRIKKGIKITLQLLFLYLFYALGSFIQEICHLSIPGSILGLLVLLLLLLIKIIPLKWIEGGASLILLYLPLFFIPATVGIVNHMEIFSDEGLALILITIVSTILTAGFAGTIGQKLYLLSRKRG